MPWLVNIAFGRLDAPTALTRYTGSLDDHIRLAVIGLDVGDLVGAVRAVLGLGDEAAPLPPAVSVSLHSRRLM